MESVKHPGFLRLMNAVERPTFRTLIMSEESRSVASRSRRAGPSRNIVASSLETLTVREERLADLNAQLERLDGLSRAAVTWGDDSRGEIRARLTDWQGIIGRQPVVARQILHKLLVADSS